MEATTLMTTRDHLFGEVIIEDTDAAATRTANEWQGTAIWTEGSRLEDGYVGCAVAPYRPENDAWTGVRVHMPDYRHLRRRSAAQEALQRITSDVPGPGQRQAVAIGQLAYDIWGQRRVSVQFWWVPSHAGTAGDEKADEWAKMAVRNERGLVQLPYELSSTSLAHLKRGITKQKWVEACSWMESRLSKPTHTYHGGGCGQTRCRPKLAKRWPRGSTSSGRGTPSSGRTGKRASDACWWCDRGVKQSRESLFKMCTNWKFQQAILWAEVRRKTKKRKG